jgi:hypothetical protein
MRNNFGLLGDLFDAVESCLYYGYEMNDDFKEDLVNVVAILMTDIELDFPDRDNLSISQELITTLKKKTLEELLVKFVECYTIFYKKLGFNSNRHIHRNMHYFTDKRIKKREMIKTKRS